MAKILIIDDDYQITTLLKKWLNHDGHHVYIALDGDEGTKIFYQFFPELIITDIIMPKKNGFDVIVELLKFNQKLPIIAISGGKRPQEMPFNFDFSNILKVENILQKPFTQEELRKKNRTTTHLISKN